MIKIEAYTRLESVVIKKDSYTDKRGAEELSMMTHALANSPTQFTLIGAKNDFKFWKRVSTNGLDIVCTSNSEAVGSLHLRQAYVDIRVTTDDKYTEYKARIPSSYVAPEFRGLGLMLYMYKWALSQYNLLSDVDQSKGSHELWKKLAKDYKLIIFTSRWGKHDSSGLITPDANLKLAKTRMLLLKDNND